MPSTDVSKLSPIVRLHGFSAVPTPLKANLFMLTSLKSLFPTLSLVRLVQP